MEAYLKKRSELIAQDRALRPDHAIARTLSADEQRANQILRSIRTFEDRSVWNGKLPVKHVHGPQQMFPGMEFLTGQFLVPQKYIVPQLIFCTKARDMIVNTKLFDLLSKARISPEIYHTWLMFHRCRKAAFCTHTSTPLSVQTSFYVLRSSSLRCTSAWRLLRSAQAH